MAHELTIQSNGQAEMFFRGETPWHGLGVRVNHAPTIEEAIKLAGLDWKVILKPLITTDGTPVSAHATVREDNGLVLGVVGPTYKPYQNADAFAFINRFLEEGKIELETAGSLKGGRRVWVMARIKSEASVIVKQADDRVEKYILIATGHDGTLQIMPSFTPKRVVCQNTLAMALEHRDTKFLKVRHRGNVIATMGKVADIMNVANQHFEATAEQYRLLAKKSIGPKELEKYVRIVFSAPAKTEEQQDMKKEVESRVLGQVIPLFEHGRGNDLPGVKGTMWAAYQAANEYLLWTRGKDQEKRIDSAWFGGGKKLNERALDEAVNLVKVAV